MSTFVADRPYVRASLEYGHRLERRDETSVTYDMLGS
jgi:hypothetical protein